MKTLTIGSLFAGIGGLDLGLERTGGFKTVWQVEIDDYARRVLKKHWPDVRRWGDVRTFPPEPADEWRCDIVTSGDPCQANSIASGPWGSRTASLGGDLIRIVDALRPRLVLRENPRPRKDAPWPWWRVRRELESLGYAVLPFRLRACCLGAHCQRDRVFLLAELVRPDGDRLEGRHESGTEGWRESRTVSPPVHQANRIPVPRPGGYGSRARIPGGVDRVRAIGNACPPVFAEWIGRRILEAEEKRNEPTSD